MEIKNKIQKHTTLLLIVIVVLCAVFLFASVFNKNKNPKIIFLDVGQGDSIFIIAPNGRQVLVDAGKYSNISAKISPHMSLSDRSIDIVIATHPDIDHVAGFDALLNEYNIGYFVHSGLLAGASVYDSIAEKIRNQNINSHTAISGEIIFLDKDMYLEILSPYLGQKIDNPNDHSVVVRLVYKDSAILLTGDASKLVEQNLVSMYGNKIQSDILKLGHHGSKTSTSDKFIKTVNPKYGIISASCGNSFGHPHASVLRTLAENEVKELSTCNQGDIVFEFTEGEWVLEN